MTAMSMENTQRVLIVEDNATSRRCMKAHFESLGHEVVAAVGSGEEALVQFAELSPSLVVMDLKMPGGIDGLEAAKQINSIKKTPIILVTGESCEKKAKDALSIGVSAYLVKPVSRKQLLPAIEMAVGKHSETLKLAKEIDTLKSDIETRKLVERAKGILMKRCSIGEDEAFKMLQSHSQKENKKMGEIANMVISANKII